jgi:multiple sugar transport system substrate-binding protein
MKRTKVIAISLSILMILTMFGGCKSTSEKEPEPTAADQTKETTKSDPVTIEVLFWDPENMESSTKVMNEFRAKYPDIKLDFQYMTGGGINKNIQPRVTANNLPDMFSFSAGAYANELADTGWLADISDTTAWANQVDSLKEAFTSSKGVKYGASNGLGIITMYYNQDILDKASTKVPTNLDELTEASKKINNAGYAPIVMAAGHTSSISHALTAPMFAFNILRNTPEAKDTIKSLEYDYSSPEVIEALSNIKALADNKCFQEGFMGTDYNGAVNMFLDGKAAMLINGTWLAAQCLGADFNVGMALVPFTKASEPQGTVTIPETGQVLSAKSSPKKIAAAKKLLEFFYGEGYKYFQNPRGCIPPMPEDKYPGEMVLHDTLKGFISLSSSVDAYSHTSQYLPAGVTAEAPKQIQNLLSGGATAEQVAKALNDAQDAEK